MSTPKQRNHIYKKALNSKNSFQELSIGLCSSIATAAQNKDVFFTPEMYEEFWLFRPEDGANLFSIWFEDEDDRINVEQRELVLMFCIEMSN
jgi:hypothetical protein